jgi:hypothetical protein
VRLEVVTAVTVENAVGLEVVTAVTVENAVFWGVTPCGSCKNRRFGGNHRLPHQVGKNQGGRNVSSN